MMIGDSILLAPKLEEPKNEHFNEWMLETTKVEVYLPHGHLWYDFNTKEQVVPTDKVNNKAILYLDFFTQGILVKGGSIIVSKLHKNQLSVLRM